MIEVKREAYVLECGKDGFAEDIKGEMIVPYAATDSIEKEMNAGWSVIGMVVHPVLDRGFDWLYVFYSRKMGD